MVFNVTANVVINAETNNNEAENEEVETLEPAAGSSGGEKKGIMDFFKSVEKTSGIPPPEPRMSLENQAVKAGIKIALKAIKADWSYKSLDNICEVLVDIAPDSRILQKLKMKSRKLSYVVSHGLGPFFHNLLVKDLQKAHSFTLGLDSATTKQLGLSKSLDFKVRYFSERYGMVSIKYTFCESVLSPIICR